MNESVQFESKCFVKDCPRKNTLPHPSARPKINGLTSEQATVCFIIVNYHECFLRCFLWMEMGHSPHRSPPSVFYWIGPSSQGHVEGRWWWREEVQSMGGAPASLVHTRVGAFYGNRQQWATPLLTPTQVCLPCLTTTNNPTHPSVAPPRVPEERVQHLR